MSTNGLTSWAVDLKDIGAIYPFQGSEVLTGHPRISPSGSAGTLSKRARRVQRSNPIWRPTGAATRPEPRSIATSRTSRN